MVSRRQLLKVAAMTPLIPFLQAHTKESSGMTANNRYDISLSQWSFHRAILGNSKNDYQKFISLLHSKPDEVLQGELDPRDIVKVSRQLEVDTVDLVNVLFFGHAQDKKWLSEFKSKAKDNAVGFKVLMCDETGKIGSKSKNGRKQAIENHLPWFECAAELGCTQLRVNAYGDGNYLEQLNSCVESLSILGDIGNQHGIEVLVENHGDASNIGAWLAMLMQATNHHNVGVFTDFDNFFMGGWNLNPPRLYDRTQGLLDLAPYTRGISAKSHDFSIDGQETTIDFEQSLNILLKHGFKGTVSAEYEGNQLGELEGSKSTVALLKKYQ